MSTSPTASSAVDVVNQYLGAFYDGAHDRARRLVADEFSFHGPFVTVTGRDPFFASAAGLTAVVRGHLLLGQWSEGEDVCSIFEVRLESPVGTGTVTMSEWHQVRDGLLQWGRVLFDSAEFRALLPAR